MATLVPFLWFLGIDDFGSLITNPFILSIKREILLEAELNCLLKLMGLVCCRYTIQQSIIIPLVNQGFSAKDYNALFSFQ